METGKQFPTRNVESVRARKLKVNIYDNLGLKIVVSSDVWDVWSQHIQYNTKDSEACGIIVGGYYPKSKK